MGPRSQLDRHIDTPAVRRQEGGGVGDVGHVTVVGVEGLAPGDTAGAVQDPGEVRPVVGHLDVDIHPALGSGQTRDVAPSGRRAVLRVAVVTLDVT